MAKKTPTKISELIPDDKNFNLGSEYGNSLIAKSIQKFGGGRSILLDKNNRIIAGNKTIENAGAAGIEDLQIVESDGKRIIAVKRTDIDLDSPEGRELALADNATAKANIVFDAELIEAELGEAVCQEWGVELPENEVTEDGFDAEPPLNPITVLGDLYVLDGKHRVLCGDSTDSDTVAKLMDGKKADMVFTDPPYGVAVNQGTKADLKARNRRTDGLTVENDALAGGDLKAFLLLVFKSYSDNIKSGAVLYVCHAESLGMDVIFRTAFAESGFKPAEIIIWVKDQFAFGRQDYHWRHEPIIYGWKEGGAHKFLGEKNQSTVWEFPRPKVSKEHPTMKPVALVAKGISNSSKGDDIVMDLFLGSGTTLIASEELNRTCYGMELSPNYADVVIARYIKLKQSPATAKSFTITRNGKELSPKDIQKYLAQIEPKNGKDKTK